MSKFITANQAVSKLGVTKKTLYAYVSRGLVRSQRPGANSRDRLYLLDDVNALVARKRQGRTPAAVGRAALTWGVPVLELSVSFIEGGRLYYRGQDAVALAENGATLEEVASLLWQMPVAPSVTAGGTVSSSPGDDRPIERCIHFLTRFPALPNASSQDATRVLYHVAEGLSGIQATGEPLHRDIARGWDLTKEQAELLRLALALCADHELNASTFTVRCVASTGANLPLAICAGLAALSGPFHGGSTARAADYLRKKPALITSELQHNKRSGFLTAFGHPLYPDGDPRAQSILKRMGRGRAVKFLETIADLELPPPNLDFALGALEVQLRLPRGAGLSLFALGRTVGWIAHALEQRSTGALIRPRARYVGVQPAK